MDKHPSPTQALLTPKEAAQRLLEEATLLAVRTNGVVGLRPVREAGRVMFRKADVDGLIREAVAA